MVRESGMYDLAIAHNLGHGLGPSFDGAQPTNAASPLWMLVLAPSLRLASSPDGGIAVAVVLQTAWLALSTVLVFLAARRLAGIGGALAAGVAWLAIAYRDALSGTDYALHAALVAALLLAVARGAAAAPSVREAAMVGALAGSCVLVRRDDLALAAAVAASLALAAPRGRRLRTLTAALVPAAVAAVGITLVSLALSGTAIPVDAAVLWDWSRHELARDGNYQAAGFWAAKARHLLWPLRHAGERYPFSLVAGVVATAALVAFERRATPPGSRVRARALAPFAVFAVAQMLAYGMAYHGEFSFLAAATRYVVPAMLTAVTLGLALDRGRGALAAGPASRAWSALCVAACALGVILIAGSAWRWRERERGGLSMRPDYDAARVVEERLPRDAVLASWRTGAAGYLSGRRVVDLSGLVNSWTYFRVERHDLCAYWERERVTHLVDLFEDGRPSVDAPVSASYARCADRLERVWTSGSYGRPWRLEIYRLKPPA